MNKSEILLYQTEDGQTKINVRLEENSVWLSQAQMSELFQKERSVITKHIKNVFEEGELIEESNVQILHISGSDRPVKFYNLDVIISIGYRVKSHLGTKFRQWATARLKEYIVKCFSRWQTYSPCHDISPAEGMALSCLLGFWTKIQSL